MVWQMLSDDNNDNNVHDDEYEARFWQETKWTPDKSNTVWYGHTACTV